MHVAVPTHDGSDDRPPLHPPDHRREQTDFLTLFYLRPHPPPRFIMRYARSHPPMPGRQGEPAGLHPPRAEGCAAAHGHRAAHGGKVGRRTAVVVG